MAARPAVRLIFKRARTNLKGKPGLHIKNSEKIIA